MMFSLSLEAGLRDAAVSGATITSVVATDPSGWIGAAGGVYVGGAGDVALTTMGGTPVTFKAVPVGTLIPIFFTSIQKTGTTATNLLALA